MDDINLNSLKIFYEVANSKSFLDAANKLLVSQPAVSKSMSKLEEDLGVLLFYRDNKGIELTPSGEILYKYLKDLNGKEFAQKYYKANEKAKENIKKIIDKEKINCDLEQKNAYVFTESEKELQKINWEVETTKMLDIKSQFVDKLEIPIDICGAIKFENQYQFNPVKYVQGLANCITKEGMKIYEKSKVSEIIQDNGKYNIITKDGLVRAKYLVIATRYPIIKFPGYYFIKMYQSTSYSLIVDTQTEINFDGYYINSETPTLSFRTVKNGDKRNCNTTTTIVNKITKLKSIPAIIHTKNKTAASIP